MTHTGMLWIEDALIDAGVRTIALDGWHEAQGDYLWTDPSSGAQSYGGIPSCFMVHHSASSSAVPSVRDDAGRWSKANAWCGLERDGKLYQEGPGIPTVILVAAGPARVSSGYGHWNTALDVFDDVRVPWKQTSPDGDRALNRYAWNVETVHRGDGGPIDPGVEEALEIMGALLCNRFGWAPWRTIGHLTWSSRKIDPYWNGEPDRIVKIQDRIAELLDEEEDGMDLATWARTLRNPLDFDQMELKGIITEAERDYWITVDPSSPEFQDLRNAVEVRNPIWSR